MISERDFPTLLGHIYEAASDFSGWERVLRSLAAAFDGNGCVLGISGTARQFSAYVAPLTEPAFLTAYNAYYHRISPLMPRIKALPAGSVVTDRMVLARSDFIKSEIYNDWILPQGLCNKLYSVLLAERDQRVMIGVHRTHEFDDRDVAACRLLTPHLQRAMHISLRLRRLEADRASLIETLDRLDDAVVLADADARPLLINKAAQPLFASGEALRLAEGRLAAIRPSDTARLLRLIASCGGKEIASDAGGRVSLACQRNATLIATVVPTRTEICWLLPCQPVAMIFLRSGNARSLPAPSALQAKYKLTPAEAALALEICEGGGLGDAAGRQGIRLSTAKTHLAHIFEKTGVRRQAELVRLIVQS